MVFSPDREYPEADVSHVGRKRLDLAYAGISPSQRLDIYLPQAGEGPFPVVLFIHGGAFAYGDKRDVHVLPFLRGLDHGYAVVGVNYRMSGEAVFPAGVQDVKAAIRWLRAHAGEHYLDARRVVACGTSSGANFAALVGLTEGVQLFDDPTLGNAAEPADVQAVVDLFGPTDFLAMDEQLTAGCLGPADHGEPGSPESLYLGATIADVPDLVRAANPMTYIDDHMPPILIQHGTKDWVVPVQQSIEFARAIEERVGPGRCEVDLLEGADHDDPAFFTNENLVRIFGFLERRR